MVVTLAPMRQIASNVMRLVIDVQERGAQTARSVIAELHYRLTIRVFAQAQEMQYRERYVIIPEQHA